VDGRFVLTKQCRDCRKTKLNEEKAAIPAEGEEEKRAWSG